jgi:hypothetical protein
MAKSTEKKKFLSVSKNPEIILSKLKMTDGVATPKQS